MRINTVVSASLVAVAVAAMVSSVSASGQPATREGATAGPKPAAQPTSSARFVTLKGVKAVPMAPRELNAVKGLHIHFATPSGLHFVNQQENNLGNGQAPAGSGPGYSGLCGAALASPALSIPGQNTTTGAGGGC